MALDGYSTLNCSFYCPDIQILALFRSLPVNPVNAKKNITSNVWTHTWSTKWSLFTKLFAWMDCKSRDESNEPT